jgi:hypothetical protein
MGAFALPVLANSTVNLSVTDPAGRFFPTSFSLAVGAVSVPKVCPAPGGVGAGMARRSSGCVPLCVRVCVRRARWQT